MINILIVDDNTGDIDLMRTALCEVDPTIHVYAVPSAVQALAFLSKEHGFAAMPRPRLVLLDINMPCIGGFEVLRIIRATPAWSGIPVVVWSSSSRRKDKNDAVAFGAVQFVIKPSTWDGMIELARVLRGRLPAKEDCTDSR